MAYITAAHTGRGLSGLAELPADRGLPGVPQPGTHYPVSGLGQPACTFETGEVAASRTSAGILAQDVFMTQNGLLAADFGVDRRSVKASTKAELGPWLSEFESDRVLKIRILGLTDCSGAERYNRALRLARARRVYALLGPKARAKVEFVRAASNDLLPGTNATREERAKNRGVLIQFDRRVDVTDADVIEAPPCHLQLRRKALALLRGGRILDATTRARLTTALEISLRGGDDAFIRPGQGSLAIPFHWSSIQEYFRLLCQSPDASARTSDAGLAQKLRWLDDDIVNGLRSYRITRQQASQLTRTQIELRFTGRLNAMLRNKSQTVYAGY